MPLLEFRNSFVDAYAGGHRKSADVVAHAGVPGRDEIGQALVRFVQGLDHLLPQEVKRCGGPCTRLVGIDIDIIADTVGREQSDHRGCAEPFLRDDARQHLLRVIEQVARRLADDRVLQYLRIASRQLPRLEKRRPVDHFRDFLEGIVAERLQAA